MESLHGLYLNESFPATELFVYGSFLTSIDGRIAIGDATASRIPENLSNSNDFRLFLELRAHADCIVTHGGYLRARADGVLGDILHPARPLPYDDLLCWRKQQGLPDAYFVAICSTSLKFPEPTDLDKDRILIVTSRQNDTRRIQKWQDKGYRVEIGGEKMAEATHLIHLLQKAGCRKVFLAAGPQLLAAMLAEKQLHRLYLTVSHQFLGSRHFHTLIEESQSNLSHCQFEQARLIYDNSDNLHHAQCYSRFDISYR